MNLNALTHEQLQNYNPNSHQSKGVNKEQDEINIDETFEKSAVSVSISMNAQIVLLGLDSKDQSSNNFLLQSSLSEGKEDVLNFLSGKEAENGLTLKDIGYEGKPITELTPDEAKELVDEDGFFGVTKTSDRVANFVFAFAGNNLDLLNEGRKGIIQGFEEAERLFGGKLPEISYKTQERTLDLIDKKIEEVKKLQEK